MIRCFLIEPSGRQARLLRRFGPSEGCPKGGLHDAHALLDIRPDDGSPNGDNHPHDDPAWPTAYPCGCPIPDTDMWQACRDTIWRADDGRTLLLDLDLPGLPIAPPGAMWRSPWYEGLEGWGGPDGHVYTLRTPGGDWVVDAPSPNGSKWTRTGTPPILTARPSILAGRDKDGNWLYHGFLTDGHLESC